jgi:hypothetical protein
MQCLDDEYNCYLKLVGTDTSQLLDIFLLDLARDIWSQWATSGECPEHFDLNDLEIPSSQHDAVPLILEEIQKYVEWTGAKGDELSVHVRCASVIGAQDSDLFESICLFLFAKSQMPYVLIRHSGIAQGCVMVSEHSIGYRDRGTVTLETTTDFFDRVFGSDVFDAASPLRHRLATHR